MSVKIDQALIDSFINGDFGLSIAHENLDFDPVYGTPYVEISVFENDITGFTVNDLNQSDGVFQIILRYPENSGTITAKTKAELIGNYYKIGSIIQYNSENILTVSKLSIGKGSIETGWYKIEILINYKAFIERT